jgi:hypothetical protein
MDMGEDYEVAWRGVPCALLFHTIADIIKIPGFEKFHNSVPDGSLRVSDGKSAVGSMSGML